MKRPRALWIAAGLLCLLCLLPLSALGEPITVCGVEADTEDTYLCFDSPKVNMRSKVDELIRGLDRMPRLEKVDMFESWMKTDDMDRLMERYPQIDFGWTVHIADHEVRTDATAFSTLHTPYPNAFHTSKDFELLRFCRHLEAIDLGHNKVRSLDFLLNFPHLKVLILGVNGVRDLSVLAELKELEYLELFNNPITDLTPLTGLENLRDLNVCKTDITDISPLYDTLPHLERFWCSLNGHIRQDQRDAMEAAHPDCEFDWVNHPTGGTWRTHPHYDTIYEMFHTGVYKPFDD